MVDQVRTGVSVRLLAHHLIEAGVRGPVAGGRNHPGHQDRHVDGNPAVVCKAVASRITPWTRRSPERPGVTN